MRALLRGRGGGRSEILGVDSEPARILINVSNTRLILTLVCTGQTGTAGRAQVVLEMESQVLGNGPRARPAGNMARIEALFYLAHCMGARTGPLDAVSIDNLGAFCRRHGLVSIAPSSTRALCYELLQVAVGKVAVAGLALLVAAAVRVDVVGHRLGRPPRGYRRRPATRGHRESERGERRGGWQRRRSSTCPRRLLSQLGCALVDGGEHAPARLGCSEPYVRSAIIPQSAFDSPPLGIRSSHGDDGVHVDISSHSAVEGDQNLFVPTRDYIYP